MKAMILAAGKGTRVVPLTYDLPKPMVPVLGRPVMEYLIEHLAQYGVHDIMVNVSHLHEKIENYFGEGRRHGVQIGYSFEGYVDDSGEVVPQPLGSAGGMRRIQEVGNFFDETTIVLCGDALIDLDLSAVLREHRESGAMATVITKEVAKDKVSDYGVVVSSKNGRIRSFQEKPHPNEALSNQVSTGIYLFEPEVIDLIPPNTFFDIGSQLFPLLIKQDLPFYAQNQAFNWIDIGTVTDYWSVLQNVMSGKVAHLEIPGTQIADGVWAGLNTQVDWGQVSITGPVYIGSGVRIESGCKIVGPVWIGHGSHLCSGASVEQSVLFEYTRVHSYAQLSGVVVYKDYLVNRSGEMKQSSDLGWANWSNARDRRIALRSSKFVAASSMGL